MKNLKKITLSILGATLLSLGVYSCSNEEEANTPAMSSETNNAMRPVSTTDESYVYAADFYGKPIQLGNSVKLLSDDKVEIQITEVVVDGDHTARGYLVTETATNNFMYFADVNRVNDVLTVYDAKTKKQEVFDQIATSEDYLSTDKFDFIAFSPGYVTKGSGDCGFWRRMFGRCREIIRTTPIGLGQCQDTIKIRYYFLGLSIYAEIDLQTHPC